MNWKAHIIVGIILVFLVFYLIGVRDYLTLVVLSCFGGACALIPDLDHQASKGRQFLDVVFGIFIAIVAYIGGCEGNICIPTLLNLIWMAIVFIVAKLVYLVLFRIFKPKHRGITHTIFATVVFGIGIYLIAGTNMALAGLVGYFSHLIADQHVKVI